MTRVEHLGTRSLFSLYLLTFSLDFTCSAALMSSIYEENKDEDGFLYMTYSGENTFGLL